MPYLRLNARRALRVPRVLFSLAVLLLAGCAGPATPPGGADGTFPPRSMVTDFSLEARFSVTGDGGRHSGRLSWRHVNGRDELQLSSPFGQVLAEIQLDRQKARLVTSDQRVFEAPDAQQLTREVLGYALPIQQLSDWVLGRQASGGQVKLDALGRPLQIDEGGWLITYEYDQDTADAVPGMLAVSRPGGPDLRLRIEEWRVP